MVYKLELCLKSLNARAIAALVNIHSVHLSND